MKKAAASAGACEVLHTFFVSAIIATIPAPLHNEAQEGDGGGDMAWYRCSCGVLSEKTPRMGDTIVSVYHLHRSTRLDGGSAIVLMEEVPAPPPERDIRLGGGGDDD